MVRAPCAVCGAEEAPFKCDRCFGVRYCGAECFESDTCLKKVAYHRSAAALCEAPREANDVEEALGLRVAGLEAEVARLTMATASAAGEGTGVRRVDPKCRTLFMLGDPVGVTRSPIIFPLAVQRLRASGADVRDAVLVPLDVPGDALDAVVAGLVGARNGARVGRGPG